MVSVILCIFTQRKKRNIMKKLIKFIELIWLFIKLPFNITNGQKKHAYREIKTLMVSVNLL